MNKNLSPFVPLYACILVLVVWAGASATAETAKAAPTQTTSAGAFAVESVTDLDRGEVLVIREKATSKRFIVYRDGNGTAMLPLGP